MKVIVAGATGLVGRHLLEQCISSSQITHIYTLSRKQLPNQIGTRAEVTAIRHDDFTSYPAGLLDQISDAEACLWYVPRQSSCTRFPSPPSILAGETDIHAGPLVAWCRNSHPWKLANSPTSLPPSPRPQCSQTMSRLI
ncbi:hypothetical protein J3459_012202 [Metarhizium acridum]|nr:hypothetical protein J3459_012202 [Metarhizium acridum]